MFRLTNPRYCGLFQGLKGTATDGEEFDAIITLFFIDTARNLMWYIESTYRLLKRSALKQQAGQHGGRNGGTWINLGPLLYATAPFLQLLLDQIIRLSKR